MPPSWQRPSNRPLVPENRDDATARERRPVLHVGVVGHRRLARSEPAALSASVARLFATIRQQTEDIAGTDAGIRCVSNLAEGADTLLAEAALAVGATLLCPLPFPRDVYARDFASAEARAAYAALLDRAEAIYELDGSPEDPNAYLIAGRLLLAHSDLVVAIWDGRPERGPGGTGQIVREARLAGCPVLVVADAPPHAATLLWRPAHSGVETDLAVWLRDLLQAPAARHDGGRNL